MATPAIRPKPGPIAITPIDIQLLKDAVNLPDATDAELRHFGRVAASVGLDPLKREIYCVKRWNPDLGRNVVTHQTGIDGFRVIAERTGKYNGQTAPAWCGKDGKWQEVWLDESNPPAAARIGVYREGFREPIIAIARYCEYCQYTKTGAPTRMWRTMPSNQLAKCCEALALRKAFPNELSGLYTGDEMGQADNSASTEQKNMAATSSTIPPAVAESTAVNRSAVIPVAAHDSHLAPFKESLGERYYYRVLKEIGNAPHSSKLTPESARKCFKMFRAFQMFSDFRERLGVDCATETLKRHGFNAPSEVPTIEEFNSILAELHEIERAQ